MRFLFPFALLLFFACTDQRAEVNALEESTMRVHDEAMSQMSEMKAIGRQLKKSLATVDSLGQTGPQRDSLLLGIRAIDLAGRDMMDWMAGYKAPDQLSNEEALKYLTLEKQKIDKNKSDIDAATTLGKSLLNGN
jgi:hypothetical protein